MALIGFPVLVSTVLLIPAVQTGLVRIITNRLSTDLNAEISIQKVRIAPFSGIHLSGFLMKDQLKDTLFYAENVRAGVDMFSLRKKHLYMGRVRFQSPVIHLEQHEEEMNFSFLMDALIANRKDSAEWKYSIRNLVIRDGQVSFSHSILENPNAIKNRLYFTGLELDVRRMSDVNDSLVFEVADFAVREEIGLAIEAFRTTGFVYKDRIVIRDLLFRTAASSFDFAEIELPLVREDTSGYEIPFRGLAREIVIAPDEVRMLFSGFPHIEDDLRMSGLIFGSLENLKGRQITGSFGQDTRIVTSFDINGLSNFNEAFLYLDIESFQTSVTDLELLFEGEAPALPPSFKELGLIRYKGNVTGFINDLVAFGAFTTNLGVINTDIGLKLMPNRELIYSGLIRTSRFHLGRLLNLAPAMRRISLDMEISGNRRSGEDYFLFMDGNIASLDFNDYLYSNIAVQGLMRHQMFDGSVRINDPNGRLDFIGKVDMSGVVPHFNFSAAVANAQLDRLKLLPDMEDGVLSVVIETNFEGDNLDDLVGEIVLLDGLLSTRNASIDFDSVSVRAHRIATGKQLVLESAFARGTVTGNYSFRNIRQSMFMFLDNYLPSLAHKKYRAGNRIVNDFEFDVELIKIRELMSVFVKELDVSDKGHLKGHFSNRPASFELDAGLDFLNYKSFSSSGFEVKASSRGAQDAGIVMRAERVAYGKFLDLMNFSIHQKAGNDTLVTNVFWNNWDEVSYSGALYSTTGFKIDQDGNRHTSVRMHPSAIIVADTIWNLYESQATFYARGMSVRDFRIEHLGQFVTLNGFLHKDVDDGLKVVFNRLNLKQFLKGNESGSLSFAGEVDGELTLRDYYREPLLTSNLTVADLYFNGVNYGALRLNSNWNRELEALTVSTLLSKDGTESLRGFGLFHPGDQFLDFQFNVDSLEVGFLNPFLNKVVQNVKGTASGRMFFKGPISKPYLTGRVRLNDGGFNVDMLQTGYSLADSVIFYPNEIRFKEMLVTDRHGRSGRFRGSIYHAGNFSEMIYNLRLDANNMFMLNTRMRDNPYYYGTVYGTGFMQITGNTDNINIAINGRTRPNTMFYIPMQSREVASESDFIRFVSKGQQKPESGVMPVSQEYAIDLSGVRLDMDIEVTPDAQVQIIFDERIGDILRSTGAGNIQIRMDRQGNLRFFGDYTISDGDYLFSLQNLINKRFTLNQGGTVKWTGDPYNADIDITAVYRLKASLSELIGPMSSSGERSSDLQRRIQIHCNLMLSDRLQQPVIRFGLEMPTLDESRESLILDMISSEDELNRQVLSLLILNRFYTPDHLRMSESSASRHDNTALLTTTEMLSSQISRWFSSISNDVDVGFAYRPADNITSEELELAISTQVFNNRVSINGNVGYGKYYTNTSKLVGDFDMDIKLNRSGTIRARAYTRSNEDLIYETSPTTQGIGLSFKEEFDEFRELMRKYWRIISGRKDGEEDGV